jgi:hypothetical protein
MTKNLANIRIYGDQDSAVYVGDKGTTMPITLAAPDAALKDLGWISEDGADINREVSSKDFTAWQGSSIVRSKITGTKNTVKVTALEETAVSLGLYYPGMTATTTTGVTRIAVPGGSQSNEKALVIDYIDDTVTKRYAIPRAEVTSVGTISHKNTDMTMYEFTFTIYGDFEIITNNPALASA